MAKETYTLQFQATIAKTMMVSVEIPEGGIYHTRWLVEWAKLRLEFEKSGLISTEELNRIQSELEGPSHRSETKVYCELRDIVLAFTNAEKI